MIRKRLQNIPLETGNRWAVYALIAWVSFVAGWVSVKIFVPAFCWYAA